MRKSTDNCIIINIIKIISGVGASFNLYLIKILLCKVVTTAVRTQVKYKYFKNVYKYNTTYLSIIIIYEYF